MNKIYVQFLIIRVDMFSRFAFGSVFAPLSENSDEANKRSHGWRSRPAARKPLGRVKLVGGDSVFTLVAH
jgi:hypothetical protein